MKKLLLSIIGFFFTASTIFAYDFQSGNLYYKIIGSTEPCAVEVTYQRSSYNYSSLIAAVIPETVTYNGTTYTVTSIGESAFSGCSNITSVTIPNSVTSIGHYAFRACTGLTSVTIPNSVTSIGHYAFRACTGLTSVIWNAKNCADFSQDSYSPFYNSRSQIISFTLGNEVEHIPEYLCYGMSGLTAITIPNSVTSIGRRAFSDCSSLTSVTIPNSVTRIGINAFYNIYNIIYTGSATGSPWGAKNKNHLFEGYLEYANLEKTKVFKCKQSAIGAIVLPESVTSIEKGAFSDCYGITSINIPDGVTSIGDNTFSGCNRLASINIPEKVTYIGNNAFQNCAQLTAITIPEKVTAIGEGAFSGCSSLSSITWNARNCNDAPWTDMASQIINFTLGENVEIIPDNLCLGMQLLTTIIIPKSVTTIGKSAFSNCSSLKKCIFGEANSEGTIPTPSEGKDIVFFLNTNEWRNVYTYAWNDKESNNAWPGVPVEKLSFTYLEYEIYYFEADSGKYDYCIFNNGYSGSENQTKDLVWTSNMCYNNTTWISLNRNNTEETFNSRANLTTIEESAFQNCSQLTAITIPEDITTIGEGAFSGCSSLNSITWNARNCNDAPWTNIASQIINFTLGENVEIIPDNLCLGMQQLTTITIPEQVTNIGHNAFQDCSMLTQIIIPNTVQIIGDNAFKNCANIETISLGSNVMNIGKSAFCGCQSVYEITCKATKTPNAYDSTFENVSTLATLYVPEASIRRYQIHPVWSRFYDIQAMNEIITTIDNTDQDDGVHTKQKVIRNGQVMILCDGDYYNMLGQKCE